jgi:HEAT repeats
LLRETGTDDVYNALARRAVRMAASDDPHQRARFYRLLHILQSAPHQLVMPAIHNILAGSHDDETLAQCLKFLRDPEDLPHVRANVSHLNWVVRLQVAQAFGRFGTAQDIPSLALLLGDPVWWVRYRAAQAIVALTRGDAQALADLRAQLKDRFALDMLAMAAAEKGQK